MNKLTYLLEAKEKNPREIYDTWLSLGGLTVSNKTKLYNKDSLFLVKNHTDSKESSSEESSSGEDEESLEGAFVWCMNTYTVSPSEGFDSIDWLDASVDEIDHTVYFYQGVASPNFKVIMTASEFAKIKEDVEKSPTSDDFIPFSGNGSSIPTKTSTINISDEEYLRCFSELGIPFLHEEELE